MLEASVAALPFEDNKFDVVTAFETVYFWPGLVDCFREVYRAMKNSGTFLICNEATGDTNKNDKWTQIISDMIIYRDVQLKTAYWKKPVLPIFKYTKMLIKTGSALRRGSEG